MLIAEFRRRTGLSRDAVRLYVKLGLLAPSVDPGNGYQHFEDADVGRMALVRTAQQLGFTLRQIVDLNREYEAGALDTARKLAVMRGQLREVEAKAQRLQALRDYLQAKIAWLQAGERGPEPGFGDAAGACLPAFATAAKG